MFGDDKNIHWHESDDHPLDPIYVPQHRLPQGTRKELAPNHELHTTQDYWYGFNTDTGATVGDHYLKHPQDYSTAVDEALPDVVHINGKDWIRHGHHRLMADRRLGRPTTVMHYDFDKHPPRQAALDGANVTWHPKAAKDLKALDKPTQRAVMDGLDGIASQHPTTMAQTHPLTGVMKGWYATKVSRGHRIIHRPNDDGGIHVGYVGLHEYEKAIQRLTSLEPDHESYWHITDNPHFAPRADHVPHDNTFSMSEREKPGLYLTKDPNHWGTMYGYQRPYLAEVHVPKGTGGSERWGNEHFVEGKDLDKVKVHRVIPLDEHIRETYGEPGRIESFHGTTHDGRELESSGWGGKRFKEPLGEGYKYSGPDVRDMPASEHRKHYERWRDYAAGGGIEGYPFGHNEFDDKKMTLKSDDDESDYDSEGQFVMRNQHGEETGRKWATRQRSIEPTI